VYTEIKGIFEGKGESRYVKLLNPEPGVLAEGFMELKEPMTFDALLANCMSIIFWRNMLSAPAYHGAIPLIDVLGSGVFWGSIIYKVFDDRMKLTGEIKQEGEAGDG